MTSPKLISLLLCSLLACSVNAHAGPDSSSTEAQLVKSLQAINDNHLDIALNENEQEQSERYALQQEVEQWRKDWSSLDTNNYLKHYSRDLPAAAWSTRHG